MKDVAGHVVLLRGANVGGKNVFKVAPLMKKLAALDIVNLGAAGTFIVRAKVSPARIRRELEAALPFKPRMSIVTAKEIVELVESEPFKNVKFVPHKLRGWAAVLEGPAKARPKLPIEKRPGALWSVRFERVAGRFALGIWRRPAAGGFVFPSDVVERAMGVSATTRFWETLVRLAALISSRRR